MKFESKVISSAEIKTFDSQFYGPHCREKNDQRVSLMPPLVALIDGIYHAMSKFYDLQSTLNSQTVLVVNGGSFLDYVLLGLEASHTDLTSIEKIRLITWLKHNKKIEKQAILDKVYPALCLDPNRHRMEKIQKVLDWPETLIEYFDDKKYAFKQLFVLQQFDETILMHILNLAAQLPVSASNYIDWAQMLSDISVQYNWTPTQTLETLFSKDAHFPTPSHVTNNIRAYRYKTLNDYNQAIKNKVEAANFDSSTTVTWDERCEKQEIQVHIKLSSPQDVDAKLKVLSQGDRIEKIKDILHAI